MKAVVIGAGRGMRLGPLTEERPKTLVEVLGRPMLDAVLDALAAAGFRRSDVVFICGYRAEVIRARYPDLTFVENEGWERNNILASLLTAREHLAEGFVSTYADIVYRGEIVRALCASPHDVTLGCDTDWRRRYRRRSQHPEHDAEKLRAEGERVLEVSRNIPAAEADGEFIGVARFTAAGARRLVLAYDDARARWGGGPFREGRSFERAYLIDLLQHMLERGEAIHRVNTHGGYMEIDTLEDVRLAEAWWAGES